MEIGLFFGSFNPIHVGHLILANTMLQFSEEVWFIVSPQNPFKKKKNLLHEQDRYDMVHAATDDNSRLRVSDIEFNMERPSYTIDTLRLLSQKYPKHHFRVIVGGDNLTHFRKWKAYEEILNTYGLLVFPRPHTPESDLWSHPHVKKIDAPLLEISATYIRNAIRKEQSIQYLVPDNVREMIRRKKFYS